MSKKSKQPNGHDIAKLIAEAYPHYFDVPTAINTKLTTINFNPTRRTLNVSYKTHTRCTEWQTKQSSVEFSSNLISVLASLSTSDHEDSIANVVCNHLEIPLLKAMNEGVDKSFVICFSEDEIYFRCEKTKDFITIPFELSSINLEMIRQML